MIDNADIQATEKTIQELSDRLEEIITHATSSQYKDSHVQEMSDFVEISDKLKDLGYEPTEKKMQADKLNACKCGGEAVWQITHGGGTTYYGIECLACGSNNRTHNSVIFSHGLGSEGGFPPHDRKEAIAEWNAPAEEGK